MSQTVPQVSQIPPLSDKLPEWVAEPSVVVTVLVPAVVVAITAASAAWLFCLPRPLPQVSMLLPLSTLPQLSRHLQQRPPDIPKVTSKNLWLTNPQTVTSLLLL